MIKALAHICITTKDLATTERFYCGALGLKKRFAFERDGKEFGFYVQLTERNYIEFFERKDEEGEPGRQLIKHVAIEVEDMDVLEKHLQDHGVETRNKKMGKDGSWQMWCTDPNGVQIEFQQYTPDSSQLTQETVVM